MEHYRFYVPGIRWQEPADAELELPESEAHHARTVLRLAIGAQVVVFNGVGTWSTGRIVSLEKRGVRVLRTGVPVREQRPVPGLTLAAAVPKGERAEWLIEQASQLNVRAVQFLDCQRSVVKPESGGAKLEKWRRLAVESAKQCGRSHLLEINELMKLSEFLERPPQGARVLWLDPGEGGMSVGEVLEDWRGEVVALVGPEGGWSQGERRVLEGGVGGGCGGGGWVRVRLTSTVLRIETACAAVAALVMGRGEERGIL